MFLMNPALDGPEGPRGYGQWALYADSRVGPGFRPRPYSRDMELQPFTYDSIKSNGWLDGTSLALPHGLGHGWASVLWDMAWDLVDKHGFNPNAYGVWNTGGNNRAMQYVIDGLKFQGCGPGLVVARDAIIAAAEQADRRRRTRARCGLVRAPRPRLQRRPGGTGRNDGTEAFDTHPECERGFTTRWRPSRHERRSRRGPAQIQGRRVTGLDSHQEQPVLTAGRLHDAEDRHAGQEDITPRPFPIQAVTRAGRAVGRAAGTYTYPWMTTAWGDTCREFVATADSGKQYRAYYRFT